ncbi:hypothetical protein QR680_012319 [Steinernema hermaphroditum]|uniref:ATP-dependent RNA helicase n=1 Tax=Steinernema hermaphroditum TaxID=289476 RepID=A0AA39I4D9_9BILA|nr:hypothetical protein QR680_012319 [Steinernema hermaphroditum]
MLLLVVLGAKLLLTSSELTMPYGCWTDAWALANDSLCSSESYWLEWTTHVCGQPIYDRNFKGKCGAEAFRRVDFVCCEKKTEDVPRIVHPEFAGHFKHHVFATLKQMYANEKRFLEIERNETMALQQLAMEEEGETSSSVARSTKQMSILAHKWLHPALNRYMEVEEKLRWRIYEDGAAGQSFFIEDNEHIISKNKVLEAVKPKVHSFALHVVSEFLTQTVREISSMEERRTEMRETFSKSMQERLEDFLERTKEAFPEGQRFPEMAAEVETVFYDHLSDHLWGISEEKYEEMAKKPTPLYSITLYYENHIEEMLSDEDKQARESDDGVDAQVRRFLWTTALVAIAFAAGFALGHVVDKIHRQRKIFAFERFGQKPDASLTRRPPMGLFTKAFIAICLFPVAYGALDVPQGCWSDRWKQVVKKCVDIPHLVELTSNFCGQEIHDFKTKGNCPKDRAVDIEFVCCAPNNTSEETSPQVALRAQPHFKSIFKELYAQKKNVSVVAETGLRYLAAFNWTTRDGATRRGPSDDGAVHSLGEGKKKVMLIHFPKTELVYENISQLILLTSRKSLWEKRLSQMEAKMEDSLDLLFEVLLDFVLNSQVHNPFGDFLSSSKIQNTFGHFPELRKKMEMFWRDNFLIHLWGIPKDVLEELVQEENVTDAVISYYHQNLEKMLVNRHVVIRRSGNHIGSGYINALSLWRSSGYVNALSIWRSSSYINALSLWSSPSEDNAFSLWCSSGNINALSLWRSSGNINAFSLWRGSGNINAFSLWSSPSEDNTFINSSALVASVGDPQVYPDERNGILAQLNQLQAVVGAGKGYYSTTAGPVEYNMNGPYFRLKGVCYNRMSNYDDADGMVSLVLKVPATKVASSQVRQQIVDELRIIMGNKPNLMPRIASVISLPNDKTEVTFYVEERGKGRLECNLLAMYFKEDAQYKALQTKLEVEQLIPRTGISKQYLRHYLENAPEGFDPNVWAQAVAENPDPEKLIPFPIRGIDELLDRQKRQKLEMNLQNNIVADMEEHVKVARRELSQIHSRMLAQRQKQKQLSYRLLRVLAMQTLIQRYGARLDDSEIKLRIHLERLSSQLNGPGNLKERLLTVMNVLKTEMPRLIERQAQLNDPTKVFRGLDLNKFRDYLAEIQTALEQVYEVCVEHRNDLEMDDSIMEDMALPESDSEMEELDSVMEEEEQEENGEVQVKEEEEYGEEELNSIKQEEDGEESYDEEGEEEVEDDIKKEEEPFHYTVLGQQSFVDTKKIKVTSGWIANATLFAPDLDAGNLAELQVVSGLHEDLLDAVRKHIPTWFPVQTAVLPTLLAETNRIPVMPPRDIAISAPTGSGKTLCFLLPILNSLRCHVVSRRHLHALIVVPVQSLAQQIEKEFSKYNVIGANVVLLCASREYSHERQLLFGNKKNKASTANVIIATPGRLVDHLMDVTDGGTINLSHLRYLVVDEADRMTQMARLEWLNLVERRANASTKLTSISDATVTGKNRMLQKILVSATLSKDVERLHMWKLRQPRLFRANIKVATELKRNDEDIDEIEGAVALPSQLIQKVVICKQQMKPLILYDCIRKRDDWKKVLVFANQKMASFRLSVLLKSLFGESCTVEEFSSNLYGSRRRKTINRFVQGKTRVLICSDAVSRGIDLENVDCVVNYDKPHDERLFIHRAGRTARAGRKGELVSLFTKDERMEMRKMLTKANCWNNVDESKVEDEDLDEFKEQYRKALGELKKALETQPKDHKGQRNNQKGPNKWQSRKRRFSNESPQMTANYFMKDMVSDALQTNFTDTDWSNVALIAPFQNDQALLYEYADCLAVRAYLKMISLPFRLEQRPNAEFMSPTGKVPFLKVEEHLVADFQPIVDLVAKKGLKLSATLTDVQLIDMYAHMALIEETLKFVEMHICWFDKATYDQVTKPRYGTVYLWPLRHVLPPLKRREISSYLEGLQWREKSAEQLKEAADRTFKSLSVMLGSKEYFMGSQPTELDALAFGHLYTILTTELPNMDLAELVRKYDNLVKFVKKIDLEFFTRK